MNRTTYILVCLLAYCGTTNAQYQASYDIKDPDVISKTYIARDRISFLPGYSFSSQGNKTLSAKIDERLLLPAVYQTSTTLADPSREINTSLNVGAIVGKADVSPTGAATYSIPIPIPAGTGGVQPNIDIVYNSQNGNGLLGYGWSLNCISQISRTGKTIYHDGNAAAIDFTNSDGLSLDGQRLIRIFGLDLAPNTSYGLEIEKYSQITCKSINAQPYFELKTKEGWVYVYGNTPDSYIETRSSTAAETWLLSKVIDPNGNYMVYTYDENQSSGEYFLKQIDYTGNINSGQATYYSISFFYENRSDIRYFYVNGRGSTKSVILKRISVMSSMKKLKEFKFNYLSDGMYTKLTEIEEFAMDGTKFNSTIVDWGDKSGEYSKYGNEDLAFLINPTIGNEVNEFADFDGDGMKDFLSIPNKNSYTEQDSAVLYLGRSSTYYGNGFFKKTSICMKKLRTGCGFFIGDFNGDGKKDLIIPTSENNNSKYEVTIIRLKLEFTHYS